MAEVTQAFNYLINELSVADVTINSNYVKYIEIENMYNERTLANLYIALHVPVDIYDTIVNNETEGKVNLSLAVINVLSKTSISEEYFSGQFSYLVSSNNPDQSIFLMDTESNEDMTYKSVMLSLIKEDYLDKMKSSLCGTYSMVHIQDMIRMVLEGMPNVVVQKPNVEYTKRATEGLDVNKMEGTSKLEDREKKGVIETIIDGDVFEQLVIPPITNRKDLLEYIFNLKPFYKTAYTFFADFCNVYLIAHDEDQSSTVGSVDEIIFHVTNIIDESAYVEGMMPPQPTKKKNKNKLKGIKGGNYISGNKYHIYINPSDIKISPTKAMDKISTTFMSVTDEGVVSEPIDLAGAINRGENTKLAIRKGNYPTLYANILNSSAVFIEFTKAHIDSSKITPDKLIRVEFDSESAAQYNGCYYMDYKRETIRNNSGNFIGSCAFGLYKIGEINDLVVGNSGEAKGFTNQESRLANTKTIIDSGATSSTSPSGNATQRTSNSSSGGETPTYRIPSPTNRSSASYNAKNAKKGFQGPPLIDKKSSGAVVVLNPHTSEPRL